MKEDSCKNKPGQSLDEKSKRRCFEGKVKNDMPDGRRAGESPCKDADSED